jgi:hypothetical protein
VTFMIRHHKAEIRNLALLAGVAALALMAIVFLHLCLHSFHHDDTLDSEHHCLLCTVFSCTILTIYPSGFPTSLHIVRLPLLLKPICIGNPSIQKSVAVRAPPRMEPN